MASELVKQVNALQNIYIQIVVQTLKLSLCHFQSSLDRRIWRKDRGYVYVFANFAILRL